MDRRNFLKTTGALAAGVVLGPSSAGGAPLEPDPRARASAMPVASEVPGRIDGSKSKLSLAAYSFREELSGDDPKMSLEDFVELCAREGLDGTELTSYYFRRTDPEYLLSLRRLALVNGLSVSGTPVGNDFCLAPGERRDAEIRKVKEWIDHTVLLGSQTIRVFAGHVPRGDDPEAAVKRAIEGLAETAEYAGARGVMLALENHGGPTATAAGLLEIVRGVDSPWLGVNLDTGNFHTDVWESLAAAAPYAVSVQVKIETREGREEPVATDYGRLASLLDDAGYRGWVALEFEGRGDPATEVPKHLARLREAL